MKLNASFLQDCIKYWAVNNCGGKNEAGFYFINWKSKRLLHIDEIYGLQSFSFLLLKMDHFTDRNPEELERWQN